MRIWDIHPKYLCRVHLLGEHRELHGLWNIVTEGKNGYSKHPETQRWYGKTKALYKRHELLVQEMQERGYKHASPLDMEKAQGVDTQLTLLNTLDEQIKILTQKPCVCFVQKFDKKKSLQHNTTST